MALRFRRRVRAGFRRPPREPVSWFRQEASTFNANAFGVTTGPLTLFDPESVVFGSVDTRITVRRLKLALSFTYTRSAGVAQALVLGLGVYMTDASGPIRDPLLTTEEDQETDWLYLAQRTLGDVGGAGVATPTIFGTPITGSAFDFASPDIRAMRKLDNQQVIVAVANLKRLDPATFAAPTLSRQGLVADISTLYSRTMR